MPARQSRPLLQDMVDHAREAIGLVGRLTGAELAADRMRYLATIRLVEVVGEAASQVAANVRDALPDIPFRQAVGMRNRLIHGYGTLSAEILADTVRSEFPGLIQATESALVGHLPDETP